MPFYAYPSTQLENTTPDTWGTVDQLLDTTLLRDILPANTIGLVVRPIGGATVEHFGLRHPDCAQSRVGEISGNGHCWCVVKCNSNIEFEAHRGNTDVHYFLEGYITDKGDDVVLFTNAYDKTPPTDNAWNDVDLSGECPNAIGIIFEVQGIEGWFSDARKNGSTSGRTDVASKHYWGIMGCDASQIMEYYKGVFGGDPMRLYILGYIKSNGVFKLNWRDITPRVVALTFTSIRPLSSTGTIA